jgi:hypothetical protein
VRPRRTSASDKVYRLPGGTEDNDLWVETGEQDGAPTILSTWELSEGERRAIADGGTIDLIVWGGGMPPVALEVGLPLEERKR